MAGTGGGNCRKADRNKLYCARYLAEGKQEKHKAIKLIRHLKKVPWDKTARAAFEKLDILANRGNVLPEFVPMPETGIWRRKPAVKASEPVNA